MTQQELDAIKARCEAAMPAPWYNFGDWMVHTESDVDKNGIHHEKVIGTFKKHSADFIAHARTDIPTLLAEVERLRDVQRWIPVTERLPNETDTDDNRDSCVLAIHKKINQCYFNWNTVVNNPFDFTHWMPLPELPEKEGAK